MTNKEFPQVDIEMVLEGSYPYVTGGVSAWTHRLIKGMPDKTFGIVHLASRPADTVKMKFDLPDNVLYIHHIYIHDPSFMAGKSCKEIEGNKFYNSMYNMHIEARHGSVLKFKDLVTKLTSDKCISSLKEMFYSEKAFALLIALYKKGFENSSFIDFFWTWRYMHVPLFQIFQTKKTRPKIIHAASTGYAGFYAAMRKMVDNIPFLLTEHGIYTRERAIEIVRSETIFTENTEDSQINFDQGTFKRLWLSFFEVIGKWTYQTADQIITLFEGNKNAQIDLGAPAERIEIIPNGISLDQFMGIRKKGLPNKESLQIGFVGRVVSIKDLKTLLRSMKIVTLKYPKAMLHIIGPLEEEKEYAKAMIRLSHDLGISDNVKFHGTQNVKVFYQDLDLLVFTSISEGQPLTMLEAMAAGLPIVGTDVGGCRELVEGRTEADQELGACGIITNLSAPGETARAIIDILTSKDLFQAMVVSGNERVKAYYSQENVLQSYKAIYEKNLTMVSGKN